MQDERERLQPRDGAAVFLRFQSSCLRMEDMKIDEKCMTFMDALGNLDPEPKDVFRYFRELSEIPRGSRCTDQAAGYLLSFAEKRNLTCTVDAYNNVAICKDASEGMEDHPPVMLQAHLDMVVERDEHAGQDPRTHGISVYTDGDWMKARGTTLGADDGIGCAMILAILDDDTVCHPRIEALFTSDEEIGMKGAERIDEHILNVLRAGRCINLDTHCGSQIVLASTGGLSVETVLPIHRKPLAGSVSCRVRVMGLSGGHSGRDILKGRGNALMILGRVLYELFHTAPVRLVSIQAGNRLNVIPSCAEAEIVTTPQGVPRITEISEQMQDILSAEYADTDSGLQIEVDIQDQTGTDARTGDASSRGGADPSRTNRSGQRDAGADDSFWKKAAKKQVVMHTNTVVSAGTQRPPEPDVRIYRRVGEKETLRIPLDEKSTRSVLSFLMCVPQGIISMSPVHPDVAEMSAVISQAELKRNEFRAVGMIRSFSETRKYYLAERMETLAETLNGDIMTFDNYHAWVGNADSPLADAYEQAYRRMNGDLPVRTAAPASLECGVLCDKFGGRLDVISIGPTVENAHSTRERLSISSTQNVYEILKQMLKDL